MPIYSFAVKLDCNKIDHAAEAMFICSLIDEAGASRAVVGGDLCSSRSFFDQISKCGVFVNQGINDISPKGFTGPNSL